MLIQLRQSRCRPGQRAAWVEFMDREIIPFQSSKGMVIMGNFTAEEDDDAYVWIRRFDDDAGPARLTEQRKMDDGFLVVRAEAELRVSGG